MVSFVMLSPTGPLSKSSTFRNTATPAMKKTIAGGRRGIRAGVGLPSMGGTIGTAMQDPVKRGVGLRLEGVGGTPPTWGISAAWASDGPNASVSSTFHYALTSSGDTRMQSARLIFPTRLLASAAGLLLAAGALAGTVRAADDTPDALDSHTHQLHGVVKATPANGATAFTVTTRRFGDVTVSFSGATARDQGAHARARAHEVTAAASVKAGARVVVLGEAGEDGKSFVARRVRVLPETGQGQEAATRIAGTITGVATANDVTTLTLKLDDGSTRSVALSPEAKVRPKGKTLADLTNGLRVAVVIKDSTGGRVAILPA